MLPASLIMGFSLCSSLGVIYDVLCLCVPSPRSKESSMRVGTLPLLSLLHHPGEFHGQSCLVDCSPWCCRELDTTKQQAAAALGFEVASCYLIY